MSLSISRLLSLESMVEYTDLAKVAIPQFLEVFGHVDWSGTVDRVLWRYINNIPPMFAIVGKIERFPTYTGCFKTFYTVAVCLTTFFVDLFRSIVLTILLLDKLKTMCYGTCTVILVRLATIISITMFRGTFKITFRATRLSSPATIFGVSEYRNSVPLYNISTATMFLGSSQVCLDIHIASCVLVAVTNTGVASQAAAKTMLMSHPLLSEPLLEPT